VQFTGQQQGLLLHFGFVSGHWLHELRPCRTQFFLSFRSLEFTWLHFFNAHFNASGCQQVSESVSFCVYQQNPIKNGYTWMAIIFVSTMSPYFFQFVQRKVDKLGFGFF
jgi:hypothetical protein